MYLYTGEKNCGFEKGIAFLRGVGSTGTKRFGIMSNWVIFERHTTWLFKMHTALESCIQMNEKATAQLAGEGL